MKCKLIRDMDSSDGSPKTTGTIIDHPKAFRLVQMGVAVPEDDECRDRAGMTPERMEQAKLAYERADKGIHPDDFDDFDSGAMSGYDAEGSPIRTEE